MKAYYDDDFTGLWGEYCDEGTDLDRKDDLEWELRLAYKQVIERHPEWAGKKPSEVYDLIVELDK